MCEFCENAVSPEAAKRAIGCKQCSTLNVETAQQCIRCKGWLVVQCLFCNAISRHDLPGCASCREPFAGAAERKAARDAALRQQQLLQTAGVVAPIAGSLLGGLAGALLGNSFGGGSSSTDSYGGSSSHSDHSRDDYSSDDYSSDESSSSMRERFSAAADDDDESGTRG